MKTEGAAVPAYGVGEGGANATLRILAVDGGQSAIRVRLREGDAVETDGVSRIADSDARVADAIESAWRSLGQPGRSTARCSG